MKKDKFPSQIKIYEKLPEKTRKLWYSRENVVKGFPLLALTKENFVEIDTSDNVKKRHFLTYNDEYLTYLKHGDGLGFYNVKYDVDIFYNYNDIKKLSDKVVRPALERNEYEHFINEEKKDEDLQEFLNDNRVFRAKENDIVGVKFYGEDRYAIQADPRDLAFRNYYGMFMMQGYIRKMFKKKYNIEDLVLDAILHLYPFQYFVKHDIASFYRATDHKDTKTTASLMKYMKKLGYIEDVEYKKTSLYKQKFRGKRLNRTRDTYNMRCTDKLNKVAKDYMDYVLLRRKFKSDAESYSNITPTLLDFRIRSNKQKVNSNTHFRLKRKITMYAFYEQVYEYVNHRHMMEYMDDEVFEECRRAGNVFKFSSFIWEITKTRYLATNGDEDNSDYIKRFLTRHEFGLEV